MDDSGRLASTNSGFLVHNDDGDADRVWLTGGDRNICTYQHINSEVSSFLQYLCVCGDVQEKICRNIITGNKTRVLCLFLLLASSLNIRMVLLSFFSFPIYKPLECNVFLFVKSSFFPVKIRRKYLDKILPTYTNRLITGGGVFFYKWRIRHLGHLQWNIPLSMTCVFNS